MLFRELSPVLCLMLALVIYQPSRVTAQVPRQSFVTGAAEDEAAIRRVLALGPESKQHAAVDLDWENAFGVRFNSFDTLNAFLTKRLGPTEANATLTTLETKIRFVDPSIAVADAYIRLVGQINRNTGKTLPERWIRETYVLKKFGDNWILILERVADLRAPWYRHFTSLPSPVSVSTLGLYVGTYEARPGLRYQISRDVSHLVVKTSEGTGIAIPGSDTKFFYFRDPSVPGNYHLFIFSKLPDGTITFTESAPGNYRPISFKKIK